MELRLFSGVDSLSLPFSALTQDINTPAVIAKIKVSAKILFIFIRSPLANFIFIIIIYKNFH